MRHRVGTHATTLAANLTVASSAEVERFVVAAVDAGRELQRGLRSGLTTQRLPNVRQLHALLPSYELRIRILRDAASTLLENGARNGTSWYASLRLLREVAQAALRDVGLPRFIADVVMAELSAIACRPDYVEP